MVFSSAILAPFSLSPTPPGVAFPLKRPRDIRTFFTRTPYMPIMPQQNGEKRKKAKESLGFCERYHLPGNRCRRWFLFSETSAKRNRLQYVAFADCRLWALAGPLKDLRAPITDSLQGGGEKDVGSRRRRAGPAILGNNFDAKRRNLQKRPRSSRLWE